MLATLVRWQVALIRRQLPSQAANEHIHVRGVPGLSADGLVAMGRHLQHAGEEELGHLRGLLSVGVHCDLAVTEVLDAEPPVVTQVYCSALPLAYSGVLAHAWEPPGWLVLEAAYEPRLLAAVEQARRGGTETALLTRLGESVFGTPDPWINDVVGRSLGCSAVEGLDIRLGGYGDVHPGIRMIEGWWRS